MADEIVCAGCGGAFMGYKSSGRRFCGEACWKSSRKAKPKNCLSCGCLFTPVKLHSGSGKFISHNGGKTCSAACHIQWIKDNPERKRKIGEAFRGERHPNWQGGKALLNNISNRGPNWPRQRAGAIKRDGRCVDCGITDEECKERYGRSLDVDHVVPFHNFSSYRKANALSNLACRCASCHTAVEAKRSMVQMVLPMQDGAKRMHKGRARGERVNTAKLTAAQVRDMRRRYAAGESRRQIAERFGVELANAHAVLSGKTWKHLPL